MTPAAINKIYTGRLVAHKEMGILKSGSEYIGKVFRVIGSNPGIQRGTKRPFLYTGVGENRLKWGSGWKDGSVNR
jgi:hypothetical protein